MSLATDHQRNGYRICRNLVRVCGQDPFAERGSEDLARPYLRPDAAAARGSP